MDKLIAKQIFEAIKKDDVNAFITFVVQKNLQNICFGRFPILSVCYLFGSQKIISKYEKYLARISKFEIVDEFYEIYLKFKHKAKKSLRLFVGDDAICYPIQMLAVLDKREKIAEIYSFLFKNEQILLNVTKIYNLNHLTRVSATSEKWVCERKKLSYTQKFWLYVSVAMIAFFSLFSLGSVIGVSQKLGLGTRKLPILISTKDELVLALQNGDKFYKLQNDLTLESINQIKSFAGSIDGNNHTITIKSSRESLFENLTGTIQNVIIKTEKTPEKISQNYSIISENLVGIIENVQLFAKFDAKLTVESDTYISAFTINNEGTIKNSTLEVTASFDNSEPVNSYFAGFAGTNSGTILNCKAKVGKIKTNTVDVAVCSNTNTGTIENFENNIEVSQISGEEWNPNCSGVVGNNLAVIKNSINNAKIEAVSTAENQVEDANGNQMAIEIYVAGIACQNAGSITKSKNFGDIVADGNVSTIYAGGIVSINTFQNLDDTSICGLVKNSKNVSNITTIGEKTKCIVGGIVAYNLAAVTQCGSNSTIKASKDCIVGGVVGFSGIVFEMAVPKYIGVVNNSYSDCHFIRDDETNPQKDYTFACLVGLVQNYLYDVLSSNHYVVNESYNALVYFGSLSSPITDNSSCNATAYDSFDEIPNEVRNYAD